MLFIKSPHTGFPIGVLAVNILGCFLIGLFYGIFARTTTSHHEWVLFLTTGVCGGFTTFSTFANDSIRLLQQQNWGAFGIYITASILLGLGAVIAGYALVYAIAR